MEFTMNKNGFILLEIIVSIILLSVTGIALFFVSSNEEKLNTIAIKKLKASKEISIVINQHSINLHNKKLISYELLKSRYTIKNKKLKKILKNSSYQYKEKFVSSIKIKTKNNDIAILIDKIKISDRNFNFAYLTLKE